MKIGILTSGGDCPGLNAVIRGFGKYVFNQIEGVELYGIADGYGGLIRGEWRKMTPQDFVGILNLGGTILGTSRQPFKLMTLEESNSPSKLDLMKQNYKKLGLDCLVTLGGAGTHKTAALLSAEGCHVIGVPKTIDNDIYGTDVTFGFDPEAVVATIAKKASSGKAFNIIAIAEGAMSREEAAMKKKARQLARRERGETTATQSLARLIAERVGVEARVTVPGYMQRGGNPSAYDRVLSTEMGSFAGKLAKEGRYGVTVAVQKNEITYNSLADIAGRQKSVPVDHPLIKTALSLGVSFGVDRI